MLKQFFVLKKFFIFVIQAVKIHVTGTLIVLLTALVIYVQVNCYTVLFMFI